MAREHAFAMQYRSFELRLKGTLSNSSGAAAVEFALVTPVFLLFTLSILAYGIYFGAQHSTAQLAADAARASVAGLSDQERADIAVAHVAASAHEYPLLDPEQVMVTAAPAEGDATLFKVSVRYDASSLPIWGMAALLPLPTRVIERTAIIKRGGF